MATAQAQTGMNTQAAITEANLNRINQYTPQGSLTYSQTGTNPDGTPQYSQYQSYSPAEQTKYDQNNQVAMALNGMAINNIGRVGATQSQDFNFNNMTPLQTSVGGGLPNQQYGGGNYDPRQQIDSTGVGQVYGMAPGAGGQIQKNIDYSGLTKLPGTSDFGAEAQKMNDAVYGQATSRLDPRFNQSESDMKSQLAAKGITENSDAYRRELDNFNRSKTDAYNQAQYTARQAGADEQSRLFGLSMGARQQGQNEVNAQGQFVNAAQQQGYGQEASNVQIGNEAQNQRYGQAQSAADMYNTTQGQRYSQDQGAAQFSNEARNQAFNQQSANAALNNQGRQQQITEASYLRNLPLNEIASLLGTGVGVSDPTFQDYSQVNVDAGNYQGAAQNQYNAQQAQYTQNQANRSQMLGSIFGTAGKALTMFSDRRMKRNIKRVGELANGIATYTYNYVNDAAQRFGVMAQEAFKVVPEAVVRTPSGYLAVDYGKVF
jgi:hypothetical protein